MASAAVGSVTDALSTDEFNGPSSSSSGAAGGASPGAPSTAQLRFEDLTIDDELNILDRVTRYCRSGIALQRLVHVKMLSEVVPSCGTDAAINHIVPLLSSLVADPESIIRQHLALQLLPMSTSCLSSKISENPLPSPERGYKLVTDVILPHLTKLLSDPDQDVRKASSDSIAGLAAHIQPKDVNRLILHIPIRLSQEDTRPAAGGGGKKQAQNNTVLPTGSGTGAPDGEDLRVTAAALLGELSPSLGPELVHQFVTPTLLSLSQDLAFRVRKSAAQAIPHAIASTTLADVEARLLPAFVSLSRDEVYRVRKTCAECMVDMSRGIVALKGSCERVLEFRRKELIPLAMRLLEDGNKFVRQGMMQFLGPFIASFFPLSNGGRDMTVNYGIVPYFPHSVLHTIHDKQSSNEDATGNASNPKNAFPQPPDPSVFLPRILSHRESNPPHPSDVADVTTHLLPHFTTLATISTSDATVDAEMRVHCAYSLPAALLLLGHTAWTPTLKNTFLTLCSSDTPAVKRCLASSLHVVANILPCEKVENDVLPLLETMFLRSLDDVTKTNAFKHLSSFLETLTWRKRSELLPVLTDIILATPGSSQLQLNWRLRYVVAKQLPRLLRLFDPTDVRRYVTKIIFTFLGDNVAVVRDETFAGIPILFAVIKGQEFEREGCTDIVTFLKTNMMTDFSSRMGYCRICAEMGQAINNLSSSSSQKDCQLKVYLEARLTEMLPIALNMKDDRVTNVRANLRKCLISMEGYLNNSSSSSTVSVMIRNVMRELEEEAITWEFTGGWEKDPFKNANVNNRHNDELTGAIFGKTGSRDEEGDESGSLASI